MAGEWCLRSHPRGEWLLIAGQHRVALPPALGRALEPLRGRQPDMPAIVRQLKVSGWTESEARQVAGCLHQVLTRQAPRGSRPLFLRIPICPARWTDALAARLQVLASGPVLMVAAGVGLTGYLAAPLSPGIAGHGWSLGLILFALTAFWHELGHASALRHEGYSAGGIGAGILFIIPVFFTDVSAMQLLDRAGRLRVDLAGMAFQLGAGGCLALAGAFLPSPLLAGASQLAGWLALGAILWSLLPFVRSDGYWVLCDLLQLEDLDRRVPPGRSRKMRIFLVLHRLLNGFFLLAMGGLLTNRLHGLLQGVRLLEGKTALLITLVLSAVCWWGIARRLLLMWAVSRQDLRPSS